MVAEVEVYAVFVGTGLSGASRDGRCAANVTTSSDA